MTDERRDPGAIRDELPADLDVTRAGAADYTFPDVRRRRAIGLLEGLGALGGAAGWLVTGNRGLAGAAALGVVIALWHVLAAWPVRIDVTDALATASRAVGFPVGHASAQLTFRGVRSRPTWRILLYSAEDPPSRRGLVELDAVDGGVLGQYTEDNPEDWSQYR